MFQLMEHQIFVQWKVLSLKNSFLIYLYSVALYIALEKYLLYLAN